MKRTLENPVLRPYGPGKYDTKLDAIVDTVARDWIHVDAGSVSEDGRWLGQIHGGREILDAIDLEATERQGEARGAHTADTADSGLTDDERIYLAETEIMIISEYNQGFVTITYYSDIRKAENSWSDLLSDLCLCSSCGEHVDEDERYCQRCDQKL